MARWYLVTAMRLEPLRSSSMASLAYRTANDSSSSDADMDSPSLSSRKVAGRVFPSSSVHDYLSIIPELLE